MARFTIKEEDFIDPNEPKQRFVIKPEDLQSPQDLQPTGQTAEANNKPLLKNEDGSFSTEQTITITTKDSNNKDIYVNIPTIVNGKKVDDAEAERLYHQGQNQATGVFPDLNQAVKAAESRSKMLGESIDQQMNKKELGISDYFNILKTFTGYKLDNLKEDMNKNIGGGEASLNFASSFVAAIPGTIGGLGASYISQFKDDGSPGDAYLQVFHAVQNALTYEPKGAAGKATLNTINEALDFSGTAEGAAEKALAETGSPFVATAIYTAIAGSPVWVPFAAGKGMSIYSGNKVIKAAKVREAKITEAKAVEGTDPLEPIKPYYEQLKDSTKETIIDQRLSTRNEGTTHQPQYERQPSPEQPRKIPKEPKDIGDVYHESTANKVRSRYDKMDSIKAQRDADLKRSIWSRFQSRWVDIQYDLKKALSSNREAGREAIKRVELIAGATFSAQRKLKFAGEKIYGKLKAPEIKDLDRIIHSLRTIQIMKRKGEGEVARPTGKTIKEHTTFLRSEMERMGKDKFLNLIDRANIYFETTRNTLREHYAEGLINKKQLESMINDIYEPSKFLDDIDPIPKTTFKGQRVDVRDSGIYHLDKGAMKAMETDSRALLSEYLIRAENRIFKNRALRAIGEYAKIEPDNGWVKFNERKLSDVDAKGNPLYKIDEATGDIVPIKELQKKSYGGVNSSVKKTLSYFEDGIKQSITMDRVMADQFITRDPQISAAMANTVRTLSGSFIMRPLATGMNWEFAVRNFPRDIAHAYITNSNYSAMPAKFIGQMTADLASTFKDAATKKGLYETYIQEGGGMSFLTNQADPFVGGKGAASIIKHPGLMKVKEGLTRVNEFFEVWVRLAAVNRGMKEGKSASDAVWESRAMLDFAQGGSFSKAFDHGIPYLNASIQAFRTSYGAAAKNPKRFAAIASWLGGTAAFMWIANHQINPEGWRQVSSRDRRENFIFMTPLWERDSQGNKRYIYFKFKKDNALIPITTVPELILERTIENRIPNDEALGILRSSTPLVGLESMPPTVSAAIAYAGNKDFWTNRDIWGGDPNAPNDMRFNPATSANPTPQIWKDLGKDLGISPIEAQRALSKIVPNNMFTDMLGGLGAQAYRSMTDREQEDITKLLMQDQPFLRGTVSYTHPMSREIEQLEPAMEQTAGERIQLKNAVSEWYQGVKEGKYNQSDINKKLSSIESPEERKRAFTQFKLKMKLDVIFKDRLIDGVPSRGWWERMTTDIDGTDRADLFYETWRSADPDARRAMESLSNRIPGFLDEKFHKRWRTLKRERGVERNNS